MVWMDYTKDLSFCECVEALSVIAQHCLVKLRDHAKFDEEPDPAILRAAAHASAVAEDTHLEMERLIEVIEKLGNSFNPLAPSSS